MKLEINLAYIARGHYLHYNLCLLFCTKLPLKEIFFFGISNWQKVLLLAFFFTYFSYQNEEIAGYIDAILATKTTQLPHSIQSGSSSFTFFLLS